MAVSIKSSSSFQTEGQFVEVSTMELGGVLLIISEIYGQEEAYSPRLYLTKEEALALAKMLQDIADKSK